VDSLGFVTRRERRRAQLGRTARCRCGQREPLLLRRTEVGIECPNCQAVRTTGRRNENHHLAGKANLGLLVGLDANTHTLLSSAQWDWPADTLRNPRAAPARRLAAILRALLDWLRVVLDPLIDEVEELIVWLESLDPQAEVPA
jgi:hypothetical protein